MDEMVRQRKKLVVCGIITVVVIYYAYNQIANTDKYKFEKYGPIMNYTTLTDPQELHMGRAGSFRRNRKNKLILLYTTHFYAETWKGLHPDVLDGYTGRAGCDIPECEITYDHEQFGSADLVLFHGVDILRHFNQANYTAEHFRALLKRKPEGQRWVFWMHETPVHYPDKEGYNSMFNWTMTFNRHSDIFHPYYSYEKLGASDDQPESYVNHAARKSKATAWIVSSCGNTRGEYARELDKYTELTVYGLCGADYKNMGGVCSKIESECMAEMAKYKFYLAFENSYCEDYVTEKYFRYGLVWGTVPVVMGARYDVLNAIPGSYIDASKFASIRELGEYLNYLDTHDDEYNKYFEWKKHYKVTSGTDKICLLCKAAHDRSRPVKVYKKFTDFWSAEKICKPYDKVRKKFQAQIKASTESGHKKSNEVEVETIDEEQNEKDMNYRNVKNEVEEEGKEIEAEEIDDADNKR